MRDLHRILHAIVIAGLPSGCFLAGDDVNHSDAVACGDSAERTFSVDRNDTRFKSEIDNCQQDKTTCRTLCEHVMNESGYHDGYPMVCEVSVQSSTVRVHVEWMRNGCDVGRRPAGLAPARTVDARTAVGCWLAHAAWLEAASVHAFAQLVRELQLHGAPAALVAAATRAITDEIRHSRVMTSLAAKYGATPPTVNVDLPAPRDLAAIARENALEGCVRETWGAATALHQAHAAADPEIRAALAGIADDEIRHAELAWALHAWMLPRLAWADRDEILTAQRALVDDLVAEQATPLVDAAAARILGLPFGDRAHALVSRARAALWAAA